MVPITQIRSDRRCKRRVRPWLYLPFALLAFFLDFILRYACHDRSIFGVTLLAPNVASFSWSLLLVSLSLLMSGCAKRIYLGLTMFFTLLSAVHGVLQNMFRRFFPFSSLAFAEERRAALAESDYTGLFQGKNLLLIPLEAMDTWMLSQDYMPNLYKRKQQSMVFANYCTPAHITAGTLNTSHTFQLLCAISRTKRHGCATV